MSVKKRGELSNGLPPDEASGGGDYQPRPNGFDRATELKLLEAALLDNIHAFSELFEHYRPALYTLCHQRLNDPSLAEDMVQEVFLKAFASLPNSDHRKPIWPWLATIAIRMCVDLQRRRAFIHYSGDIGVSMDATAHKRALSGRTGSALDEVIASEDRAKLWRSVDVLPERQRRALLLYALDGMSYEDIAAAEGISVGAVKLLLVRARKKIRSISRSGRLPAMVFPIAWLRWKGQRITEQFRLLLGDYGQGLTGAGMQVASLGMLAVIAITVVQPTVSFEGDASIRSDEAVASATQPRLLQPVLPNTGAPAKAPVDSQQPVAEATKPLGWDVINPTESATPEHTQFNSITASPIYESDHTIFASGYSSNNPWNNYGGTGGNYVLFVSPDGGANWKPLPSRLLLGDTIVVAPGSPQDRRIFALGDYGLQQSDDGGEIFRTVSSSALGTSLAVSPLFGREDSKVLIGGKTLFEYDSGTGVTGLGSLAIPPSLGGYSSIIFSPGYQSDRTIFVSDFGGTFRCKESVCNKLQIPIGGELLVLRLSPRFDQDGLAYAFTYRSPNSSLLVSNDGAGTFRDLRFPLPDAGFITDVDILWNRYAEPALFAYVSHKSLPGVYRSLDAGRSWNRTSWIDLPGFGNGDADKLIVTPTGRLLAIGGWGGIACSTNQGETWARRCPPEKQGLWDYANE